MSQDVKGLVLDVTGELSEVTLPAGRHLQALYAAIGCDCVDVVAMAPDLDMWVDDNGYGVEPVNELATYVKDLIVGHTQLYFGNVVFTGGVDDDGETLSLPAERAQWIREGVQIARLLMAS